MGLERYRGRKVAVTEALDKGIKLDLHKLKEKADAQTESSSQCEEDSRGTGGC